VKILVAQARARASGGAESYVAALIAVLRNMGHSVATLDIDGLRSGDGTHIRPHWFTRGRTLWNWAQVCRALAGLSAGYDRVILGFGEGPALPVPTMTIRHAPAVFSDDPALLDLLGASPSVIRRNYVRACRRVAGLGFAPDRSLTIANSRWTAETVIRLCSLAPKTVLYPKVAATPDRHVARQPLRIVALGRVVPNKRLEEAVALCDSLRRNGHAASLEIVGRIECAYGRHFAARFVDHPYIAVRGNADARQRAQSLAEAQIGFHGYRAEHFGIAVAEMILAGVVPVVFDSGGVRELVTVPALRFRDLPQAVAIVTHVINDKTATTNAMAKLQNGAALAQALDFDNRARRVLADFLGSGRQCDAA
jgi:glycosyltransferase involved in cell wall biosynthesis